MSEPYFCLTAYQRILERARGLNYRFCRFKDFSLADSQPVLLLRHDLDHSIRCALPMARLEAELRLQATYFVQVACGFYNLLSPESRAAIRELTLLGHEVGLHYESERYLQGGEARMRLELALLSEIAEQPCVSGSQHLPINSPQVDVGRWLVNEAYEPRFLSAPMQYISDSLLTWRQATPDDLLDERASFQFLSHPENWPAQAPLRSFDGALELALAQEILALERQSRDASRLYCQLLEQRERLDRAFVETRLGSKA